MKQPCPVCGNDVIVKSHWMQLRCRWCKSLIKVEAKHIKGKKRVELEEVLNEQKEER